jgi:hypothetical protein
MDNYFTDTVWRINYVLLVSSICVSVIIILDVGIRNYFRKKRQKRLLDIKKNIYESLLVNAEKNEDFCPVLPVSITPDLFLDVVSNRDRESVFFNRSEQEFFKKCFLRKENIQRFEKNAKDESNKWLRIEAILSLGYCGLESSLEILKKALWDSDEDVSYFSMLALGQIKNAKSAEALLLFLKKTTLYRDKVAALLSQFPKDVSSEVIKWVNDPDAIVRFWVLKIISGLGMSPDIKAIIKLSEDKSSDVRAAVCECLGGLGGDNVEKVLKNGLTDEIWLVRMHAVRALEKLLGAKSISFIMPLIKDNSWSVLTAVKTAVAAHIEDALPFIEKILLENDDLAKKMAVEIIETSGHVVNLYKDLLSSNASKKKTATSIIKNMINVSALYGFETALTPFTKEDRNKIISILYQIDSPTAEKIEQDLNNA